MSAKPKIISEKKREPKRMKPPHLDLLMPHIWLSERNFNRFKIKILKGETFDLYVKRDADVKMRVHCIEYREKELEVMGFLLGDLYVHKGKEYTIVHDVVTTDLDATAVHVKFDKKGFGKLFEDMDKTGKDYILVGWYHSHPGHTCFLSETDIDTQMRMFNRPFHSAIVLDPVNREAEAFKLDEEDERGYSTRDYAIIERA